MSGAVLVTGGAGYIGSACAYALHAAGRPVVVLDDLSTGWRDFVKWGPLVEGDVGDRALVRDTIRSHGVTAVMHFAAKAQVAESVREPRLYDLWNRGKTTELVAAAAAAGVGAFVFSSTCAVYGEPAVVPIDERAERRPVNPYGVSKAACEDVLFASGMPAAALRYFNAAGGLPEQGVGERHDPESHLLPLAIRAAREGRPVQVFGTDYDTRDGTCVRDYIHVMDLAAAHLRALDHLAGGGASGAWNLGTGRGQSVHEILEAVGDVMGVRVERSAAARRPGDPPVLVAAARRAARELGWRAACSDLPRIVEDAVACDALFHGSSL